MESLPYSTLRMTDEGGLTLEPAPEETPLTLSSGSGLVSTWTQGITFNANGTVSGGYYDVNKNWNDDNDLCWAAAASNMLAWWQNMYGTAAYASSSVPTDVQDIFDTFKLYWNDVGGNAYVGCSWWLCGYAYEDENVKAGTAGYYSNLYSQSTIEYATDRINLAGTSASEVGDLIASYLEQGSALSISVHKYEGWGKFSAGHALTLWGITQDEETGYLTSIHVTDSDDNRDGMFTIELVYNSETGYYHTLGERSSDRCLQAIHILTPFRKSDTTAPATPTNLRSQVTGNQVQLSWSAVKDASGVSYEIFYWQPDEEYATSVTSVDSSLTLNLDESGSYSWKVRSRDAMGNLSEWSNIYTFSCATTIPKVYISVPKRKKVSTGQADITLSWSSDIGIQYELRINGKLIYTGTNTSYTYRAADGFYTYSITAIDANGNRGTTGNSIDIDTTAPPAPKQLKVRFDGNTTIFSWQGVQDNHSGVSYTLGYKLSGSSSGYTYIYYIDAEEYALTLDTQGTYEWVLYTRDAWNLNSSIVNGSSFTFKAVAPTVTLGQLEGVWSSTGYSKVTFSWDCAEDATFTLVLDGKTIYSGTDKSFTYSVQDGKHTYTVTAKGAASLGGLTGSQSGSFTCDASAPTLPSDLQVELVNQGMAACFSWQASTDLSSVTYDLGYKSSSDSDFTYIYGITNTAQTVTLPVIGTFEWCVRAVDSLGNRTNWVTGKSFINDIAPPVLTVAEPSLSRTKEDNTLITFSWSANKTVTYELWIEGKRYYSGQDSTFSINAHDGSYSYELIATDAAGNTSRETGTIRCDASAPTLPTGLLFELNDDGSQVQFRWNESSDSSDITYELGCKLESDSGYKVYDSLTSPAIGLNLLADGNWQWRVRAVDSFGNASAWVDGATFNNDVTAPELTLNEPTLAELSVNSTQVTFSWECTEDATFELLIEGKSYYSGSGNSKTLRAADGIYNYELIATDAAGNTTSRSGTLICDTKAPDAPAGLLAEWWGKQAHFSWDAVEDVSGVTYILAWRFSEETDFHYVSDISENAFALELNGEGTVIWHIAALDGAGHYSSYSRGEDLFIDASAFKLSLTEPTRNKLSEGMTEVLFSWECSEYATYELLVNGEILYTGTQTSTTLTLADGAYSYTLTATDAAGNSITKSGSLSCDTIAPTLTLGEPEQKTLGTNKTQITFSWKSSEAATFELWVEGEKYYTGSELSKTLTAEDGNYSYEVIATDAAGNSTTQSGSFTCDASAPAMPTQLRRQRQGQEMLFSWAAVEDVSGVIYELAYKEEGERDYTYLSGITDTSIAVALPRDGNYIWYVSAEDGSGNYSEWARGADFSFDGAPPVLTMADLKPKKSGKGKSKLTFSWKSNEAATYELRVNDQLLYQGSKTKLKVTAMDGSYDYTLTATDASGNSSELSGSFICDTTAPVLSLNIPATSNERNVTFLWESNEEATYTLKLGKKELFSGTESGITINNLKDGKHSYTLTAVDAWGNKTTAKGKLTVDTVAPRLTLKAAKYKTLKTGQVQASFSWKGEKKSNYVLYVNGEQAYSGTKTSCKLTMDSTAQSYTLIATDAAGNHSETPGLSLPEVVCTWVSNGRINVSFNWMGDADSSSVLKVDGKKYTVYDNSYTLYNIKDGKHSYSLTATDALGNNVTLAGTFKFDATAPKLTVKTPKIAKESVNGLTDVTFAWSGETGANFELELNGETRTLEGKKLTLALSSGFYNYKITATDAAGNYRWQSGSFSVAGLDYELALSAGDCAQAAADATLAAPATCLGNLSLDENKRQTLAHLA